jgi:hypothetical protein
MTNRPVQDKRFEANEIARISAALVAAIAEAHALAADGQTGAEFRELLRHAREMHDLMASQLDGATEYARGLADSIGTHLKDLEEGLRRELN